MSGPVLGLIITSGKIQLQPCALYAHSAPILNSHHVIPESWWRAAGLPVASPMMNLCPTCHMTVHAAIDGLIRGLDISALLPRARGLAVTAITDGQAAGLTPALTL